VFFTLGTCAAAFALLARPSWRREIFETSEKAEPRSRFWYFVNRFISGVGSFLVYYAISLANPALVDAITGLRYVIIFGGAYGLTRLRPQWLRENFTGRTLLGKSLATLMVVAGLVLLGIRSQGQPGGADVSRLPWCGPSLELQQGHAAGDQGCACPTSPGHYLPQHVLG
jgi:drug/metabolite transporter (DMT)-like permease